MKSVLKRRVRGHAGLVAMAAVAYLAAAIAGAIYYWTYQPPVVAKVGIAAHAEGFNVTIAVVRGEVRGLFLVYGPAYAFDAERHTAVGICGGARSDGIGLSEGEVATCAFPASLVRGMKYVYELYVIYGNRFLRLYRGVVVPK